MILEVVTLTFNPATASQEIQDVFANDLARTFWLAVKQGHRVSQYFNADCLCYAKRIENFMSDQPLSPEAILRILSGVGRPPGHGIIGSAEFDFATELVPFITGERTISFKIGEKDPTKSPYQGIEGKPA